jgi:hypothetical protein
MITVRIAHAGPWSGSPGEGGQSAGPGVPAGRPGEAPRGLLVVLADDAGCRALPVWLAEDPGGVSLPVLLDWYGDDMGTMAGIPEALAARLVSAAGARVTGVEFEPVVTDAGEVTAETFAARIVLGGLPDARHVTTRLGAGLALAAVTGAPVRVPGPVIDRLAVPAGGDLLASFRHRGGEAAGGGHVIVDRRAGPVAQVAGDGPGRRPRFEPRNMAFGDGLDRWDLAGGPGQEAGSGPLGYSAAAEGRCAVLSSAAAGPGGCAVLVQAVFADDFHGAVVFSGEVRTEDAAGRAGLCLEILSGKGKGHRADRREHHAIPVTGSQDWSRQEITVPVPGGADLIRFGIVLAGRGRVWLRNPELRRETPGEEGPACGE